MVILLHFCGIISLYYWKPQFGGYMIRGIKELLEILFLWGFIYVGSFIFLIIGIVHIKSNQPIIQEQHYHTTKQVFAPPQRVLVQREVCKDISGCKIIKGGECPTCVVESVWE